MGCEQPPGALIPSHAATTYRRLGAESAFGRRWLAVLGLCALTVAAIPFSRTPLHDVAAVALFAGLVLAAAVAQIFTSASLAARYRTSWRASELFLATVFLGCGLVGTAMAVLETAWLYVAWHVLFAAGALGYVVLRTREQGRSGEQPRNAVRALAAGAAAGIALAALVIGAVLSASPHLPALVRGSDVSGFRSTGVAPALLLFSLAAAVALGRLREPGRVDRALLPAMVAFALGAGTDCFTGERYAVSWFAGSLLYVLGSAFVLSATASDLVDRRDDDGTLRRRFEGESRRAKRQASQLQQLRRLSVATIDRDRFMTELIEDGARHLRESARFAGMVAHREGAEMVVDIACEPLAGKHGIGAGARYPLEDSILGRILAEQKTASWNDIRQDARFDRPRARSVPWRAIIGTPFRHGSYDYCISFASEQPLAEDEFDAYDGAYLETLASLCESRMHERAQSERLLFDSEHDQLTRTYNRTALRIRGVAALASGLPCALIVADVDRFRTLNQTLGQHVGDDLLQQISARLLARAQPGDVVARLDGDAFGILTTGAEGKAGVELRVERFAGAFEEPFEVRGHSVALTTSIGVALAPGDTDDFEELLSRADAATYEAKAAGRARWAFFDASVSHEQGAVHRLRAAIVRALACNEFVLHYQPHVDLKSGRTTGAEALIRWQDPERGLVPPAEFIPFAERHGLAPALGEWVMRETLAAAKRLRRRDPDLCVWFNLSATELDVGILSPRVNALAAPVEGVGVEITETSAMRDVAETARAIALLHDAGFAVALDDFGTGYSSLAHLRSLPIDVVKIDRSFVAGLPANRQDVAIVEAVLSIADCFGFKTVAEGVETREQASLLEKAGCSYGQGYLYARPMPLDRFEAWLDDRSPWRSMVKVG